MKWLDDEWVYAEHVAMMMDGVDAKQRHDMANQYIPDLILSNKRLIAAVRFAYGALAAVANHDIDVTVFDGAANSARAMQTIAEEALGIIQGGFEGTTSDELAKRV